MDALWHSLASLELLKPGAEPPPRPGASLLELCDAGMLVGGLSVASGVGADELVGPLLAEVGGAARGAKVLDVLEKKAGLELRVELGGREVAWKAPSLEKLAAAVNRAFKDDVAARTVLVLGTREERLQLWCVPKERLSTLKRLPGFSGKPV